MATAPDPVRSAPPPFVMRTLLALVFIGAGVWLIVSSMNARTETLTATVSASYLPVSTAENVSFEFADGSDDDEVSPDAAGFFDAVRKFGPGPARVTRNDASDLIYKVRFHGKTYTLDSPAGNRTEGIIALVLGLLGLAYVAFTIFGRRGPVAAADDPSEPAR